ncbi:AEC family transporter [Malikia spinosa]|uniref:AEC family transporter n=1 Tax=Malikia spinosa TaxID=86180 RepID=UPI003FA1DB67
MLSILSITGPIYLAVLLGFACTRLGLFARADMRLFGKFVINLALPALLFNALSSRSVGEILNPGYMGAYALAGLLVIALGLLSARLLGRHPMHYASMFAMGMSCPNSGFVGYPVLLLSLGGSVAGVGLALNMMVENLLLIPLLLAVADLDGGKGTALQVVLRTLKGLTRNPMIIAIVAGLLASLLGWTPPLAVSRTVNLFAQASGALSLFVIGGSLAGQSLRGMGLPVLQITLGKLVLHPLIMLAVLTWLVPVADPQLRTAVLLTTAMPIMGIYTILSQRHGHEGISAAALLATTAASFFTLSGLLWWLRQLGWLA